MASKYTKFLSTTIAIAMVVHLLLVQQAASEDINNKSTAPNTTVASQEQSQLPSATSLSYNINMTTQVPQLANSKETQKINIEVNATKEDIDEVRRKIHQRLDLNHGENRLAINRPSSSMTDDYPANSIEARVAISTSQFGLDFLKDVSASNKDNLVISPLSLQNLLNMILLGSKEDSTTNRELVKVLGYDKTSLLSSEGPNNSSDRLKPHEAMRNVLQSILSATHISPVTTHSNSLLNTDPGAIESGSEKGKESTGSKNFGAHLQTSTKDDDTPLTEQLNFTLANLVLTNSDVIELKDEYEKDLKTYYDVKVEQFSINSTNATQSLQPPLYQRVNAWVNKMTHNQIDKLVNEGDLSDEDLVMVLLNAAHFKGRWLHTFNTKATHEGSFYGGEKAQEMSKVQFMRQKGVFGYADFGIASMQNDPYFADSRTTATGDAETLLTEDGTVKPRNVSSGEPSAPTIELSKEDAKRLDLSSKLNCSVLMLPFSLNNGQELSMILILPAKRDGLSELQASLSGPVLNEIYKMLSEQQVQVEIPKFSFESSYDAKSTLISLGLKEVFRDTARLDLMFSPKVRTNARAKVDKIVHKAKISMDETGAEAAAASMASIVLRNFIRPPTPVFVADHPFIFIIRHNRSNMPLFMGRVNRL